MAISADEQRLIKKADRKEKEDALVKGIFLFIAIICASVVIFILCFILYRGIEPFFKTYTDGQSQSIVSFFTSSRWKYDGDGGMIYLLLTTLLSTFLSLVISVPTSIFTALFIVRVAPKWLKEPLKTTIEILASIPSVIYGLFGMGVICVLVRDFASFLGMQTSGGKSILSAIIVLSLMSTPTITLLSITAMEGVDNSLYKASLALGASKQQTNYRIVIKAAKSGIFAGVILGTGRALGEATAIQMVIGNNNNGLSFYNIFQTGSTLTSAMLTGIGEANGIGYDVRFSLGIVLMVVIILTNLLLNSIKNRMIRIEQGKEVKRFSFKRRRGVSHE